MNLYGCTAVNSWTLLSVGILSGDVSGTPSATVVSQIQGWPVSAAAPTDGEVLVWNSAMSSWTPQNVVGQQGPQGIAGPTGPQGMTGSAGPTGPQGAEGPAGLTGPQGVTGSAGSTGPQGLTGATGPTGLAGSTGPQGAPGPTGSTGPQGVAGPTGSIGPQGPAGSGGTSLTKAGQYIGSGANSSGTAQALTFPFLVASDYAIVDDGITDNTTAINNLFRSAPAGATIFFPCLGTGTYNVTGQINFASNLTYQMGSATSCEIASSYSGSIAFNFVGAGYFSMTNFHLNGANSSSPPQAVAVFGASSSVPGSFIAFNHVQIDGYASQALVYSIGSEVQTWTNGSRFVLNGGGAKYVLYNSSSDDLSVCSACQVPHSNTVDRFYNLSLSDSTMGSPTGHCLAAFGGSATGDSGFYGGYWASLGAGSGTAEGVGLCILGSLGRGIEVNGVRAENPTYFITSSVSTSNIRVINNNMDSPSGSALGFANLSGTTTAALFQGNLIQNGGFIGSSFGALAGGSVILDSFTNSYTNIDSTSIVAANLVQLTNTQTLTNKTVDGVTPTAFGYLDATSSIQTQLNAKQNSGVANSNNAGIGNCPSNQYETGDNAAAAPTCAQVAA
ncbi:MAG: hypothetical protein JOZ32_00515, partial [Bryobacterales bacterium]|nr:hypothetical protein [Bryobacterales bacterium]